MSRGPSGRGSSGHGGRNSWSKLLAVEKLERVQLESNGKGLGRKSVISLELFRTDRRTGSGATPDSFGRSRTVSG